MKFPRYYVAGPMSGYPDHNRPAFEAARRLLLDRDPNSTTILPHDIAPTEHDGDCPRSPIATTTGEHGVACYLRADLIGLLESDRVYVLRGWEASVGARLEVQVAAACGIPLEFQSYDHT